MDERRGASTVDWLVNHSRHLMSRLIRGNRWSRAQRWFQGMGTGRGIRGRGVIDADWDLHVSWIIAKKGKKSLSTSC